MGRYEISDVRQCIRAAARDIDEAIAKACAVDVIDLACTDALHEAREKLAEALRWAA